APAAAAYPRSPSPTPARRLWPVRRPAARTPAARTPAARRPAAARQGQRGSTRAAATALRTRTWHSSSTPETHRYASLDVRMIPRTMSILFVGGAKLLSAVRATWLTDIHLNFMRPLALRAFYERVQREQPDVLLVTGDIGEADSVARFVDELGAIAPVYYVLGNHDYYRSSVAEVRARVPAGWLGAMHPVQLTERTV